ncbi:DUF72 domain-containing protein [Bradyrhizobium diazoefficiens]|uniref:DUF72 domain-containing protein n=1 Tax=Bradyrhizobium diazoefficiens TaxID=1355477 RepID=UPI00272BA28A|nr:DUF72 domain-containing protein [Bradyrhizobium diazoefficiens]WLA57519.1 DUF72 domain-containing protein [Bradyrhizobium diazoefficiens]
MSAVAVPGSGGRGRAKAAPALRIGTAGWSIDKRYADGLPAPGSHLERYARRLTAVEINSSFRRRHKPRTYERWASSVPEDFRFSVKLPEEITHDRGLVGCDEILKIFAAETAGLGSKLGTWLIQLPPKLAFDAKTFDSFFDLVNGCSDAMVAIEPRNATWFTEEVESRLIERRIARVAADPARVPGSGEPGGWRGLAYFRWHGSPRMYYSDYDRQALFSLGRRLESARLWGAETWCIFDNTAAGAALGNALELS